MLRELLRSRTGRQYRSTSPIHPGGGLGQVTAHLAFQHPLRLGDLVPGVQPAAVGDIAGVQFGQAFVRVVAHGDAGVEWVKVVAAVPAAQARPGAVTGSGFKILVPLTVLNHSSAAVVEPALPHHMGGAGTLVGGHLHKLVVHLFHAGQLQYAVKSRHEKTTVQNLHALNILGGDLPVSQAVSFGVALFFSDCKALATAAVRFPFRRLQKYF